MIDKEIAISLLQDVLNLLSSPNKYIPGLLYGVNKQNRIVSSWSANACKWSLLGAIERVCIDNECSNNILLIIKELQNNCDKNICEFSKVCSYEQAIFLIKKTLNDLEFIPMIEESNLIYLGA